MDAIFLTCGMMGGLSVAVVLRDKKLIACDARPQQVAQQAALPWVGDIYCVQITRYEAAQRAYYLTCGKDEMAFLPHADAKKFAIGARILVTVVRVATRDKRARVALVDGDTTTHTALGRVTMGLSPQENLQGLFPTAQMRDGTFFDDYATLLDGLQDTHVPLDDGVHMIIEETAALTAVDVNNANPSFFAPVVNARVWQALRHHIPLRNLGGQILIDFLRMKDKAAQHTLHTQITQDASALGIQPYGLTRLGLYEMTRTRTPHFGGLSFTTLLQQDYA